VVCSTLLANLDCRLFANSMIESCVAQLLLQAGLQ
jgi:hypothetical protein